MNKNYFKKCAVCVMAAAQLMLASCGGPAAEVSGKNPSSALPSSEVSAAESGYTTTSDAYSQGGSSVISSNVSSLLSGSSSAGSSASSSKTSSLTSSATSSKTSSTASQASAWDLKPVLVSQVDSKTVKVNDTTYKLTFSDEFNGTSLDTSKWDYCPNYQRGDLNPKNRWDDSMVSVKDGNLVLSVDIKDGVPVSGAVRTFKKNYSKVLFSQCKGYFEARIKLQSAPGFWSAFWLLDRNNDDNHVGKGARDGAEIDIMEAFSVANGIINHAIHWDGYGSNHKSTGHEVNEKSIYDGKYHTFSLEWTDTEYIFYIDGKRTYRTSDPGMCENALYLKLTAECGTWAGTLNTSKLPDAFYVDYVRVYQKS